MFLRLDVVGGCWHADLLSALDDVGQELPDDDALFAHVLPALEFQSLRPFLEIGLDSPDVDDSAITGGPGGTCLVAIPELV